MDEDKQLARTKLTEKRIKLKQRVKGRQETRAESDSDEMVVQLPSGDDDRSGESDGSLSDDDRSHSDEE